MGELQELFKGLRVGEEGARRVCGVHGVWGWLAIVSLRGHRTLQPSCFQAVLQSDRQLVPVLDERLKTHPICLKPLIERFSRLTLNFHCY